MEPIIDPVTLTQEQREVIKSMYKKAYSESFAYTTCYDRNYARGRYQVILEIFGKSMFNKKGE